MRGNISVNVKLQNRFLKKKFSLSESGYGTGK